MTKKEPKIIIIPARMDSKRLPGKPLAKISGKPMIQWVWECAIRSKLGPVFIATDSQEIADVVHSFGGYAVITKNNHPSGSDRVFEALQLVDPESKFQQIINLQGDLPEISSCALLRLGKALDETNADLSTLVAPSSSAEASREQVVKTVVSWNEEFGRALYFSRSKITSGADTFLHHIGVYGWRREALSRFVKAPPSPLELGEKLEQLRALEMGMEISVSMIESAPVSIDTEEDLTAFQKLLNSRED